MSFAESLSLRAVSTGPKTLLFNAALFALIELALELFAIVSKGGGKLEIAVRFESVE